MPVCSLLSPSACVAGPFIFNNLVSTGACGGQSMVSRRGLGKEKKKCKQTQVKERAKLDLGSSSDILCPVNYK